MRSTLLIRMLPFFFLLTNLPPLLIPRPAFAEENAYLSLLIDEAKRAELSQDPYWHTLLHYKKGLFGLRSLVDDAAFFAAENGKQDPAAELEATLRSFFSGPVAEGEKHPVCRFVSRFAWLKEQLAIDESRLPFPRCEPFEELMEQIQPESATLIFPTSHMNSPASMYGHTLITIESATGSTLLSYAINYAAITNETFGPFYIVKGLFGLYPGYFSILPYYAKLQEYSDVNDRDIWEYPLDLTTEEVRRLVMHVYELEEIGSDYFFFSENCSFELLFLLDAARPGLHLTDERGLWVIPLETIRSIKRSGLVKDVIFRPSKSTKIKHLASLLPGDVRDDALAIADGDQESAHFAERPLPVDEKITALDLAGEYLQYRNAKKELDREIYRHRFLSVLKSRSDLGDTDKERYSIPAPGRPDEGHRSNRLSIGYGEDDDRPFQEIRLRPAYHELLDNESGYKEGSEIVFFDFAMRYYFRSEEFELESVDVIDIVSIAPRDDFFKHVSWKVSTGFLRRTLSTGKEQFVYGLNPGFGYAWESRILGMAYLMFETDLQVGGALDGNYSAGAGGSIGMLKSMTDRWKIHLLARDVYHGFGDDDNLLTASVGQNFMTGANTSLTVTVSTTEAQEKSRLETMVRLNAFF